MPSYIIEEVKKKNYNNNSSNGNIYRKDNMHTKA